MTGRITAGLLLPYAYGRGYPELIKVPNPGAGNNVLIKVPGSEAWRVITAQCLLTTDAVVNNRAVRLTYTDADGTEFFHGAASGTVAASLTSLTQWFIGSSAAAAMGDGSRVQALPNMFLQPSHQININVFLLDAGDTITNTTLFVERLRIGGDGYAVGMAEADSPDIEP